MVVSRNNIAVIAGTTFMATPHFLTNLVAARRVGAGAAERPVLVDVDGFQTDHRTPRTAPALALVSAGLGLETQAHSPVTQGFAGNAPGRGLFLRCFPLLRNGHSGRKQQHACNGENNFHRNSPPTNSTTTHTS